MFKTTPQLPPLPQRNERARHDGHCPCEDCLGLRIRLTAALATPDHPLVPLSVRQRRYRVRLATDGMQRRIS
jgi:hypothetical protein